MLYLLRPSGGGHVGRQGGNFARDFAKMARWAGLSPTTIDKARIVLNDWEVFLRRRGVRRYTPRSKALAYKSETVHDYIAYVKALIERGITPGSLGVRRGYLVTHYGLCANEHPDDGFYPALLAQIRAYRLPRQRGRKSPHQPYPLEHLPLILAAARSIAEVQGNQFSPTGRVYSDDGAIVGLLLYTGLRVGFALGLRVEDIDFEERLISTRTKGGHEVTIPLHRKLAALLEDHLDARDYDAEMLFRHGRYPFHCLDRGSTDGWEEDARALKYNEKYVSDALRKRVEPRVRELFGEAVSPLRAHRIRKSVGTYASQFGLDETERRVILTHGARTITQAYDLRDVRQVGDLWDLIDLGDPEWVEWALEVGFHVKLRCLPYGPGSEQETLGAPAGNRGLLEGLESLKQQAPPGKEMAWLSLVEGLKGLIG